MHSMTKSIAVLLLATHCLLPGSAETLAPTDDVFPPDETFRPWEAVLTHPEQVWRVRYTGLKAEGHDGGCVPLRITLEQAQTGAVYLFTPADEVSVTNSLFYLPEAWAPDGRRCILPNGRFDGFILLEPTAEQPGEMRLVRVRMNDENHRTALFHTFIRWDGPDAFIFSAGLSGDQTAFRYDLRTGDYATVRPEDAFFRPRTCLAAPNEHEQHATLTRQ